MKTIRTLLVSAAVVYAVLFLSPVNSAAQTPCDDDDGIAALDTKIRNNYLKDSTVKTALEAAKQYSQKYGECEQAKELIKWFKPLLPRWEQRAAEYEAYIWLEERRKKFDDAIQNKEFDDAYAVGAEIVQRYPDNVTFTLPLGLIGLSETYKNNFKYNDNTIKYAKMALAKLKSGTAEPKRDKDGKLRTDANGKPVFGVYQFERNAEDAISELTYTLAYILYHAKKDKRAGLLYYYDASQLPGPYKTEPRLYVTVGQYYIEERSPIGKEIAALIEKQKIATTDEEKEKLEAEIKPKVALFNGYSQRAADAFSRAYKFYNDSVPAEKAAKAQLFGSLTELLRTEKTYLDQRVAALTKEKFPDPTSQVTPIDDPEPPKAEDVAPPAGKAPAARKSSPAKSKAASLKKPKP